VISAFVNYGFYRGRQTSDKMLASQQGICSRKFLLAYMFLDNSQTMQY